MYLDYDCLNKNPQTKPNKKVHLQVAPMFRKRKLWRKDPSLETLEYMYLLLEISVSVLWELKEI